MEEKIHYKFLDEYTKDLLAKNLVAFRPFTYHELFVKRIIDILGGLVGSFLFLVVFFILYFTYKFGENKGPILFRQKRYGLHGEFIYIYKFRSMRVGAEKLLKSNPDLWEKYVKNNYKLNPEEDPRITKVGKFIRKTSLDELPQFVNVLKGDLALVGPRPIVEEEIKEYGDRRDYFGAMKPGLTGIWASSGRSDINYPERADLELSYLVNHGLFFDVKILFLTLKKVFVSEGAY